MTPAHGLDDFEQALCADLIGIAQTEPVARILSALAIVGQHLRATDPPADRALGGVVIPHQWLLADVERHAHYLLNTAHRDLPARSWARLPCLSTSSAQRLTAGLRVQLSDFSSVFVMGSESHGTAGTQAHQQPVRRVPPAGFPISVGQKARGLNFGVMRHHAIIRHSAKIDGIDSIEIGQAVMILLNSRQDS